MSCVMSCLRIMQRVLARGGFKSTLPEAESEWRPRIGVGSGHSLRYLPARDPHTPACGEVAEWSIAPHSKCGVRVTVPGVRIPPSPPVNSLISLVKISLWLECDYSPTYPWLASIGHSEAGPGDAFGAASRRDLVAKSLTPILVVPLRIPATRFPVTAATEDRAAFRCGAV